MVGHLTSNQLKLKKIYIESTLPKALEPLNELANNLWWSWNKDASDLFAGIEPDKWEELRYNPVALLDQLSTEKAQQLAKDKSFIQRLKGIQKNFRAYLAERPAKGSPKVAYLCMEYGLHISLRLYSGGLGVLAGDFLKEASDSNVDMIAVGLLYRYGYFQQSLSLNGDQINNYPNQEFTKLPVQPVRDDRGEWQKITFQMRGRTVTAKLWVIQVGRIALYLLDTDIDENQWEDRALTHQLYGGDNEHRLKQEMLLGIGGVRALEAIGVQPDVFHLNEGHAAFSGLERLRKLVQEEHLDFATALEVVRSTSLFTTHTPVPAGHDSFHEGLLKEYIYDYATHLNVSWQQVLALGKIDVLNIHESFSMSHLAMRLSQEVNGVSELHGRVSQEMFEVLYPGYNAEELHIGYVTNSVHYPTWIANEMHQLYTKYFGKNLLNDQSNPALWAKIDKVPAAELMGVRQKLKKQLVDYVKRTLQSDLLRRGENPRAIFSIINNIREDALIIGFARRFATYKRAHLLFTNLDRLRRIVGNTEQPIMFVFSGKAHPADQGGQALIKRIVEISKMPEFVGKVIFLENYNMESAKKLVQGVDIWLNTPTRPKEASGTSGMKAAMNGVPNFSVLDGWWAEGYRPDAGWALPLERTYDNQDLQNELDAETIYNTLEYDILPTYYNRNAEGISEDWVAYVRNIIGKVSHYFTMKRMMDHYFERFYDKLYTRSKKVRKSNYKLAHDVVAYKNRIRRAWNQIDVLHIETHDVENQPLPLGNDFKANVQINLGELNASEIGIEVVFFKRIAEEKLHVMRSAELTPDQRTKGVVNYQVKLPADMAGVYEFGFRMFPKTALLDNRQDFALLRWL